ncbi:hypothetical protein H9Q13_08580 [Pontibacter sp. JH31]|uniref:Uncharacterized protein n=1 Tax=Pontibacter aquaedesilientis TaxID=2766980 RepID=A0ABR7XG17_9BACT|nr:hypothetical protein [Pontibacter aquaedesilientis]MBD1397217.1 hypothetical protein [Pontibacter aquaedesilientis]
MKKQKFDKQAKGLVVLTCLCFWAAWPALGQISYKTVDRHEQLKRKSLREASQTETSAYKDTHLNMEAYTFKKGESGKTNSRSRSRLLRTGNVPDPASVQQAPAKREKKIRLSRKKKSVN